MDVIAILVSVITGLVGFIAAGFSYSGKLQKINETLIRVETRLSTVDDHAALIEALYERMRDSDSRIAVLEDRRKR